jgi:putative transposase
VPRFARAVVPQCPHHITQRGNERRDVFFTTADREIYLGLVKQYATLQSVEVLGYCLMTNHVHLVLIPGRAESLAKMMRGVQMRYSQYRHALERGNGHLWQSRYYSCAVAPERLGAVMRYVELNPVRAGLVVEAVDYAWSSAGAHLTGADPLGLVALVDWVQCWTTEKWAVILNDGAEEGSAIRDATYGGRPLGPDHFVGQVEAYLGRRLKLGIPGRPRKKTANASAAGGQEI